MLCWNLIFYRFSSCLQSRRFPEDPRVGHQSAGRQNHQCLLSWGVSCPCYLSAVFGNLVFFLRSVRYRFESHPPQLWTRPSGFSFVAAWLQRGSVFSANSVFEKSKLGFFFTGLFGCSISLKVENKMFSDVSLKCVGILMLAVAFIGYRCILVALVFGSCASKKLENRGGMRFIL